MKINPLLRNLLIAGIVLLIAFSFYDLFLKPSDLVPSAPVTVIPDYYGEDVLQFLQR